MKNEERVTATRAKLIDAAIESLAEIGYHRTTFVEVSRRSSLSRGAIHHHFDSIPDLMAAVTRDIGERIQKNVREALDNVGPGVDLYDAGIDIVWEQLSAPSFHALDQIRSALTTDANLRDAVQGELFDVAKWLQQQAFGELAAKGGNKQELDLPLIRLILCSLAGASAYDLVIGIPPHDQDRSKLLGSLKRMVSLYTAEQAETPEPA